MSHWQTIRDNFVAVMESEIPGVTSTERFVLTDEIVEAEAFPESILGNAYSIQLQGISDVGGEINTIFRTTFQVRLQLTAFVADRSDYDHAVEILEAIVRERIRASTWNGTFVGLSLIGASFVDLVARGGLVANADFAVTIQGT